MMALMTAENLVRWMVDSKDAMLDASWALE